MMMRKIFSWVRYLARVIAVMPFLLLAMFLSAHAQSSVCRQIEAELANMSDDVSVGDSGQLRKYRDAIKRQRSQISKAKRAARRNRCSSTTTTNVTRNSGQCGRILSGLMRMQENLLQLEATKRRIAPGAGIRSQERVRLQRALRFNNCNGANQPYITTEVNQPRPQRRRRSLVEQIFGVRTYREDGVRESWTDPDSDIAARFSNTYRTLCVRSCDGYYFPISFSTVPDRFEHDESLCQDMCPGSEVQLYFHPIPAADSEDMISYRTDLPYTDMPTAFSYRKEVNKQCQCRFSSRYLEDQIGDFVSNNDYTTFGLEETIEPKQDEEEVAKPQFRVNRTDDPESLRAMDGNLLPSTIASLTDRSIEDRPVYKTANGKTIRIVGPAFFPVQ